MTPPNAQQMLLNSRQFLRCILLSTTEEELLRKEASHRNYRFIKVDLATVQTPEDLMKKIEGALKFPSHFGGNWDALLDILTDLSWDPASGYVVLLKSAEALMQLPSEQLVIFVRLCSAAVEYWRSGQDEEGKTVLQTPFYFFLEGQPPFCRVIADLLGDRRTEGG